VVTEPDEDRRQAVGSEGQHGGGRRVMAGAGASQKKIRGRRGEWATRAAGGRAWAW